MINIEAKTQDGKDIRLNIKCVNLKLAHCLRKFKCLNTEMIETYIELCKHRVDYNQIARILGISHTTLNKLKREIGITNRLDKKTLRKHIKFLLENDVIAEDIQHILGISARSIYDVAHEIGIKRFKNPEYKMEKRNSTEYLIKLKKLIDCIYQ